MRKCKINKTFHVIKKDKDVDNNKQESHVGPELLTWIPMHKLNNRSCVILFVYF